ncbi:histidine phosphatase family protein [Leucobacter sp. M11]|uniref:histidine phosphatase family protein n=1 Tax=Leucobacter sp. M11 TaxID=2993565 RepID=UPI002D7EC13E|nr:histidine phosphatase family protein [Leucobacter sp. M11]MEB4614412.1 histidine phosphatase family protein [Leucobacter sp. M11]
MRARIALVRHGETGWNRERRIQGRTNRPLTAAGRRQARVAAERLLALTDAGAAPAWAGMLSSPLDRAHATAEIIAAILGVGGPATLPALIERDYGAAEGLPVAEAEERWPGLVVPDAEPLTELAERGRLVLGQLLGASPGSVAVSHGALLRAGLSAITGTAVPRLENGSVWVLDRDAGGRCRVAPLA